ncbi:hypothetical protein Vadar_022187 [Vaccinium darrowii]|uniref:Uncharacterized protein n=1 Tax=Vaccinium darrowii TaxID=229202 RepID=A0ACB7YF13_9ERIC|nr:hypothetical protein Vadar_022187 [Vaccinium darrowii]
MSVEVDSVILLCKYGSHTAVIKCCRGLLYEDLVRKLCLKFRKLRGDDMQLFYTLKDNELCLLDNNESMEVMFDLACCYGIRVFRVTVFNSLDSSCLGDEVVEIGFNQSSGNCLSTEVEVNGSASSNKGSSNSIVGGAVGFAGSSCLGDEVLEIGFNHSGGSSISCLSTEVGVTCTASSSKSNVGGVDGFGGSSGSGAGLCADGGSCSNYKGKGLAEFRSEWRLELEKERDLLPMFCEHRDRPLLSDGWRNLIKEVNQQFRVGVIEFRDCLAKNAGIKATVPKAFPSSYHGFCLHHLKNNLRGRLTGSRNKYKERVVYQFSACAYAPNEMKFNEELVKLKKLGGEVRIANFLSDLPYEHWANAYFKGQRYGEMWSNMAECFNSWIEKERHLPITQLVDRIRLKMMELMCFRRETAAKWRHVICPKMDEALTNAFQESKSWEVKFCSSDVLEVLCDPSVMVDIGRRTCSCTQWQLNGVPCVHAVCAIKKSRRALNDCVDRYFHVECYREAYSRSIMPIPMLWKPEGVSGATILAPLSKKPPGRNKKKRIRSFGEKVKSIKCTRCGKRGSHNRRSCKEAL